VPFIPTKAKLFGRTGLDRLRWHSKLPTRPCDRLPIMVSFAKPDPYLLTESEQRATQQSDRQQKKKTGSVFVMHLKESAPKSHNEEQRRAHAARQFQVCCTVQQFGPPL